MKLTKIMNTILEASSTAEQAKAMGLVYAGYGRWKNPQTGKIEARTIDGNLVRVEDDGAAPGTMAAQQGAEPGMQAGPVDTPDMLDVDPDSPDAEAAIPTTSSTLERLLAAAGGDTMKVRKTLAKKFHEGNKGVKKYIDQLDKYEEAQQTDLQKSIAAVADRRAQELAARKAKYMAKPGLGPVDI